MGQRETEDQVPPRRQKEVPVMKVKCYLVERFDTPPPIFGGPFPSSPYAFIVHFQASVKFPADLDAQQRALKIVNNLLQIDRGNPYTRECPNEHIEPRMIDLD